MVDIITQASAKAQLRIDGTADDDWLAIWIPVVSQSIRAWLKDRWRLFLIEEDEAGNPVLDANGVPVPVLVNDVPVINPSVIGAALVELAAQYRFREGEGDTAMPSGAGHGYVLTKGATALLEPLRRSTVR